MRKYNNRNRQCVDIRENIIFGGDQCSCISLVTLAHIFCPYDAIHFNKTNQLPIKLCPYESATF